MPRISRSVGWLIGYQSSKGSSWWTPCGKWLRSELVLLAQLMRLTGAVT